jgi:hypothetical protein
MTQENRPPLPPMPFLAADVSTTSLLATARATRVGDRVKNAWDIVFNRLDALERRVAELEAGRPPETVKT